MDKEIFLIILLGIFVVENLNIIIQLGCIRLEIKHCLDDIWTEVVRIRDLASESKYKFLKKE